MARQPLASLTGLLTVLVGLVLLLLGILFCLVAYLVTLHTAIAAAAVLALLLLCCGISFRLGSTWSEPVYIDSWEDSDPARLRALRDGLAGNGRPDRQG